MVDSSVVGHKIIINFKRHHYWTAVDELQFHVILITPESITVLSRDEQKLQQQQNRYARKPDVFGDLVSY
jgi:hypothetical protein